MPKISVLPADVYSRIAAGEVVENPASVVKELIENSLDAQAAAVSVEIEGAGKTVIRVNDDGCGMEREDLELCLKRHATSKISAFEDLESLASYGFRGEALFALAGVSRMSIKSRARGGEGWRVAADGGEIIAASPAAMAPGTTVEIKDMFFNTPARLKFLKSDAAEKSRISAVLEESSLANPEVGFSLKSDGRQTLHFPAIKESPRALEERLSAVLGSGTAGGLVPGLVDRQGVRISIFVSPPERLAGSRRFQWWFVNRRPVDARVLQQALYHAFSEFRGRDKHPVIAAFLDLPPESFDVNVHPAKREIRFKSERDVFDLVSGTVKSALARSTAIGGPAPAASAEPAPAYYASAQPFFDLASKPSESFFRRPQSPRWFSPPYRYLGQIEKSYLVFESGGGLTVMDQHAAQERLLFEKYAAEISAGGVSTQRLMLPLPIELPASKAQEILSLQDRLGDLGFEIAPFGRTAVHVLSVPALFEKADDLKDMIGRLLDFMGDPKDAVRQSRREAVEMIACKAAVKAHDSLSEKEALRLLDDLKDCLEPACPHGRPAIWALGRDELARRFSRPGAVPI
ncbi:MAG: DNA mismatch repair endonuclease MutL [Elusimicrobiota bacterium]